MNCPNCGGPVQNWSVSYLGSYGNACMACGLFVWDEHPASEPHDIRSRPLWEVPAPAGQAVQVPGGMLLTKTRVREILSEEIRSALSDFDPCSYGRDY